MSKNEFKPFLCRRTGRRLFENELKFLLTTEVSYYKDLQESWQNDPAVIKWCLQNREKCATLVNLHGYNVAKRNRVAQSSKRSKRR